MSAQTHGSLFFVCNDPDSKEVGVGSGGDREKSKKTKSTLFGLKARQESWKQMEEFGGTGEIKRFEVPGKNESQICQGHRIVAGRSTHGDPAVASNI